MIAYETRKSGQCVEVVKLRYFTILLNSCIILVHVSKKLSPVSADVCLQIEISCLYPFILLHPPHKWSCNCVHKLSTGIPCIYLLCPIRSAVIVYFYHLLISERTIVPYIAMLFGECFCGHRNTIWKNQKICQCT